MTERQKRPAKARCRRMRSAETLRGCIPELTGRQAIYRYANTAVPSVNKLQGLVLAQFPLSYRAATVRVVYIGTQDTLVVSP